MRATGQIIAQGEAGCN